MAHIEIEKNVEIGRVKDEVYRQELEDFYRDRKSEYDNHRLEESQTAEARSKILSYRNRKAELLRLEKEQARQVRCLLFYGRLRPPAYMSRIKQIMY